MSGTDIPKQLIGLSRLAQLEWDLRQADDEQGVDHVAVNDFNRIVGFDSALVWRERKRKVTAVSGALTVEQNAPYIVFLSRLATFLATGKRVADIHAVTADDLPTTLRSEYAERITGLAIWVPIRLASGYHDGGLILLRSEPLTDGETRIVSRVANAIAHASVALGSPMRAPWHWRRSSGLRFLVASTAIVLLGLIPVRLSVLADATVVAVDPVLVTAPLDGVIENVLVDPNDAVQVGKRLFEYDQTELRAAFGVAAKRVSVLSAEAQKTEQQAFNDPTRRGEIGVLRAKLAEGRAELAYARDRLEQVQVSASAPGTVLFDDRNTWIGKPVRIGERIMSIADPTRAKLKIHIPVDDALILDRGAQVEFFLTIAPSQPVRGLLTNISYDARQLPNGTSSFVAEATFEKGQGTPRLGLTGTAKVYGEKRPILYMLLRKPLATIRRFIGY